MSFTEYNAQLLMGSPGHEGHALFNVDYDTNAKKPLDIYTDRNNYEDFPASLKKLTWKTDRNPLFIHVVPRDLPKAWDYLQEHAILDEELEELRPARRSFAWRHS